MKFLSLFVLFLLVSCQNNPQCEEGTEATTCTAVEDTKPREEPDDRNEVNEGPVHTPEQPSEPLPDSPEEAGEAPEEDSPQAPGEVVDVPDEAFRFDAQASLTNFKPKDEEKVRRAIEIIREVIKSVEFKEKVLNFEYAGKKSFVDTKLTNQEVYQSLLKASEDLRPEVDHEMDLELELYYSRKNVVGYTYPNVLRIWMNRKYFDVYTPAQVAGNIFHEWTHKLGFEHDYRYTVSRDASVPYAIGYLIRDLGKKFE